jgi:branched-chain amino acid transport system ATP-binding protein
MTRAANPPAEHSENAGTLSADAVLAVENVSKHFGGLAALDQVSFEVNTSEIFGLIGPNGAGKTTLFNVITALYVPDSGRVRLRTQMLSGRKPHEVVQLGLARTFQNIRLFANMTALENVMVGRHVRTAAGVFGAILRDRVTRGEEMATMRRSQELLDYVGIGRHAHQLARNMAYGDQRRLEIARALATDPLVLALDEPAAGMNPSETESLMTLLSRLRADGTTILLIEHDMRLVMGLCDRVVVLDYGKKIAQGTPAVVRADARVIEAYLGGVLT